jgi:hypothetical protein
VDDHLFWQIIHFALSRANGNAWRQIELVSEQLSTLSDEQVIGFRRRLDDFLKQANTWDLVNAMSIMEGNTSDDTFEYWRAGLILQGHDVFQAAIQDPETLADHHYFETAERLTCAANDIWNARHPNEDIYVEPFADALAGTVNPVQTVEQLKAKYPRLARTYWGRWPGFSPYRQLGL